jgi:hypothetical protein
MCENNWEATGPWEPSSEKMADAVRVAWSLVRLQWETVAHGADSERAAAEDAQIAIYEQYDARTLVIALTIVGGILARTEEIMLGFLAGPMSHEEAHAMVQSRLYAMHGLDWPEAWEE